MHYCAFPYTARALRKASYFDQTLFSPCRDPPYICCLSPTQTGNVYGVLQSKVYMILVLDLLHGLLLQPSIDAGEREAKHGFLLPEAAGAGVPQV